MSRLEQSQQLAETMLLEADYSIPGSIRDLLSEMSARRMLDLHDLRPEEQATLIASRSEAVQPSASAIAERITERLKSKTPFVAKFGVDPTGAELHIGHAVPMLLLSRIQRMGHKVAFIIGDFSATIGDPSGRSDERPPLTPEQIRSNFATYLSQVSPFFDFDSADFHTNSAWLSEVRLSQLLSIAGRIPVSMPLQREDFRKRLDAGHGLSLSELMYSIVTALDSVEVDSDVELGGIDQFLNMQMGRKVMEICGQTPQLVAATSLIEGTDGTGVKMSKSRNNYIPLSATSTEMFGQLMSVPDRLVEPYLKALSEWSDEEIAIATMRVQAGSIHPMDLKRMMAAEITAAIHGIESALQARSDFDAQFSRTQFGSITDVPVISDLSCSVAQTLRTLNFASSNGDVRRAAEQNGLRLLIEVDGSQDAAVLAVSEIHRPLAEVVSQSFPGRDGAMFLKLGRKVARLA